MPAQRDRDAALLGHRSRRGELRLADTKTGAREVTLSPTAVTVLKCLPRVPGNPWVIAGSKPDKGLTNISEQ